jgi:hypothetical protein
MPKTPKTAKPAPKSPPNLARKPAHKPVEKPPTVKKVTAKARPKGPRRRRPAPPDQRGLARARTQAGAPKQSAEALIARFDAILQAEDDQSIYELKLLGWLDPTLGDDHSFPRSAGCDWPAWELARGDPFL